MLASATGPVNEPALRRRDGSTKPTSSPSRGDADSPAGPAHGVSDRRVVRSEGGPLDAVSLDPFRTQVPDGDIGTVHPDPQSLADALGP